MNTTPQPDETPQPPPTEFLFAVGYDTQYDLHYVAITTRDCWDERGCLTDRYEDEEREWLSDNLPDFVYGEAIEGVWELSELVPHERARAEIQSVHGLTHHQEFEAFMHSHDC